MVTYLDVHLTYTLPVVAALALITWPFVGRLELLKIAIVSAIAFVYTTPWDNYIIANGAWTYEPENILAVVGHVPVEEYGFFVVQTVMTLLWTLVCTRWSPACFGFNYDGTSHGLIRWLPIAALAFATVLGCRMTVPGAHTFYLGCILWWSCPVVAFLWYGVGNYFVRKSAAVAVAVAVPTVYLCRVDQIALGHGVWHISERTSLNVMVADGLPLEEALFFLVTNVIIVLAGMAFDKSRGLADTYPVEFPIRRDTSWNYNRQLMRAFLTAECDMPPGPVRDIGRCLNVLKTASKSFYVASFVFPAGIRLHLAILYAFCRVTDDMIDNGSGIDVKKRKLMLIERFIGELFADRDSDYGVNKTTPREPKVDWARYEPPELTNEELSCFRALARISFYLPRKPFCELLEGYKWDVIGRTVDNETDLLLYSDYVAGSVGALCVYVMLYNSGECGRLDNDEREFLVEKARQMGQALQIVNISRDIAADSEMLGRCYVPAEYMETRAAAELRALREDKDPRAVGADRLGSYATRMVALADGRGRDASAGVARLPRDVRGPVLFTANAYLCAGTAIAAGSAYPRPQASPGRCHEILVAIRSLYLGSWLGGVVRRF